MHPFLPVVVWCNPYAVPVLSPAFGLRMRVRCCEGWLHRGVRGHSPVLRGDSREGTFGRQNLQLLGCELDHGFAAKCRAIGFPASRGLVRGPCPNEPPHCWSGGGAEPELLPTPDKSVDAVAVSMVASFAIGGAGRPEVRALFASLPSCFAYLRFSRFSFWFCFCLARFSRFLCCLSSSVNFRRLGWCACASAEAATYESPALS